MAKIAALPGVEAAGIYRDHYQLFACTIPDRPAPPPGQSPRCDAYAASPGFFGAMGLRLLRGRLFGVEDAATTPPVVVVSQTLARRLFSGEDPVGRQIKFRTPCTIVGVVADAADSGPGVETLSILYVPAAQISFVPGMHLVVRAVGDPLAIAGVIRDQVRSVDRDQPIYNVQTMEQKLAISIAPRRFSMILLAVFAGLALVLAAVGIYAVMYFSVSQRTNEIGIRMALGADSGDVLKMVVGQGVRMALLGLILGVAGAWVATRLLKSMLYQVSATDPVTFLLVPALLFLIALAASYLPARRATRVDPLIALRHE